MKAHLILLILIFVTLACSFQRKETDCEALDVLHAKSAKPNYSVVFPNDQVNRIDIKIDAEQWAKMQADLKSNIAETPHRMPTPPDKNQRGISENERERRPMGGPPPGGYNMENESIHPKKQIGRMEPPPGGGQGDTEYEPIWANCDVLFNNEKWNKVGIRFKGNSSLRTTYQQGIKKLSFKLDFDQFEEEFPEIKNQRFYGFKQLNLKNNYEDKSFIREKMASDLFAEFRLVTPKTSFCQVFMDYGDGLQYFGLYTLVEEVDDTVVKTQFENPNGNLYKPEGYTATFAHKSFRKVSANKKNNKKSKNYSDIQELNQVLNSELRTENYELWKLQMNEIFDLPVFLKYLAANNVIQNWDTYGNTTHNYYLYNNPETGKFNWIPWDNNEAFQHGKMGGALSLSLNEVNENWPLIRYIIDDKQWESEYEKYIADFTQDIFNSEKTNQRISNYQQLISSVVVGDRGEQAPYSFLQNEQDFFEAVEFLKGHCVERQIAVRKYLKRTDTEDDLSLNNATID